MLYFRYAFPSNLAEFMNTYDLIIIGAGPAGLCLARELADSNLRIMVIDKKRNAEDVQYNTSGSFINPKEWDLPDNILHPISKLKIYSKNEDVSNNISGYVIDRKKLLSFFETKARKNINFEIQYESIIKNISYNRKTVKSIQFLKGNKSREISAKIFVDCSGVSQIVGRKLGLIQVESTVAVGVEYLVPLLTENDTADLFFGSQLEGGYGWIFPKDSKTAIVGYGTLSKERFQQIETYLKAMWKIKRVSERCEMKILERNAAVLKTGKFSKKLTVGNLLVVGDSALQTNPLMGEGIRFAMDGAKIASKWIEKAIKENNNDLLKNYDKEWKTKYYTKYRIALWLQQKMKRKSTNDGYIDRITRILKCLNAKEFEKIVSGNLSYYNLIRFILRYLIKRW